MPRTPIRWDNVAQPQFNNSALAVSAGAFASAGNQAEALSRAFREQELANQAKAEQDALNQALSRAYGDGQITESDFAFGAGLGPDYYNQMHSAITSTADKNRSVAQTEELQANTSLLNLKTKQEPDRFQQEQKLTAAQIAAQNAAQKASEARGNVSAFQLQALQDEATNTARIATGERNIDKQLYTVAPPELDILGNPTSEGSLPYQANQEYEQNRTNIVQQALAKNGLNLMQVPPEVLQEVETTTRKNYVDNYVNTKMRDPLFEAKIAAENDMTVRELRENTQYGQDTQDIETIAKELAGASAEEARKNAIKMQEIIASAQTDGNRDHFIFDGKRHTLSLTTNNIGKTDAITLANRLGVTDEALITEVRLAFPNKKSFENIITEMTEVDESWLPFGEDGRKQINTEAAYEFLNAAIEASNGALSKGQSAVESFNRGPADESAINYAASKFSKYSGGAAPAQPTTQQPTAEEQAAIVADRFAGKSPAEINQISRQEFRTAKTEELQTLTQSLKDAQANLPKLVHGTAKPNKEINNIKKLLEKARNTDMRDRRSLQYRSDIKDIEESLTVLQALSANK